MSDLGLAGQLTELLRARRAPGGFAASEPGGPGWSGKVARLAGLLERGGVGVDRVRHQPKQVAGDALHDRVALLAGRRLRRRVGETADPVAAHALRERDQLLLLLLGGLPGTRPAAGQQLVAGGLRSLESRRERVDARAVETRFQNSPRIACRVTASPAMRAGSKTPVCPAETSGCPTRPDRRHVVTQATPGVDSLTPRSVGRRSAA